jgi:HK97 family phage portal protein
VSFLRRLVGLEKPLERQDDDSPFPDAFQAQITNFWQEMSGTGFSPTLIERVWVANRCIHLNAQQVARMPLRFFGRTEPAWVSNPDPVWYANGIGDAVYSAIDSMYRWGDAFLYVTSRYADGYPSAWTLLEPQSVNIEVRRGKRVYRYKETELNEQVVQVSRDPRGIKGTSAIRSYASQAFGLLAASDLGRIMMQSDIPQYALKSNRKLTAEQATALQSAWMSGAADRRGAPPVLPPEIDVEKLSFSVADLMLLDSHKFNAQVIASAMGVPALFINLPIEGGLNYQSPAMLGEHWWRFELRPTAVALSMALSAQMLPRGSYVEFDARETLAPTFADLVTAYATLAKEGLVSAEEVRAAVLRLPPQEQQSALEALTTPPSAGATPERPSSTVVALRPTSSSTG